MAVPPDLNWISRADALGLSLEVASSAVALAATAAGRQELTEQAYLAGLRAGVGPESATEVARMAHLFSGFPRAIQGLQALARAREAWTAEAGAAARDLPEDEESGRTREMDRRRGRELFLSIYGEQTERVLGALGTSLPGFDTWILEHAYGRVLSRPGLEPKLRELLAVAALAVLGCPHQLVSHARGALRLGATPPQVASILRLIRELFDDVCTERALTTVTAELERLGVCLAGN